MAANISEIRAKVTTRIKDSKPRLSAAELDVAIGAALAELTRDRPRTVVVAVTGTGAFDYLVSTFGVAASGATPSTQWVVDFSQLAEVVYPYDATSQDVQRLDPDDFAVLLLPGGWTLRFLSARPTAAQSFLLRYTRPHELDTLRSSVAVTDDEALADLSASYACLALEAAYTQQSVSAITADTTDPGGRPEDYSRLAEEYRDRYEAHVGKGGGSGSDGAAVPAAGTFVDVDRNFSDPRRTDYFFHGRRGR
jgi:hypothetical protein